MRAILLATLANTATAVAVKHQQQPITGPEFPSWEEYLDKYGLSFSASELPERQKLFEQSVADAKKQNANPKATWKATINEFAVKTPEEMTAMMGYMKQTGKAGAPGYAPMVTVSSPPNDFDWRETPGVVTAVKNQGACGSCWAFASTAVMETVIALDTGVLFNLSPQQVTSCTPNPKQCGGSGGCSGATAQLAFNYTIQTGITELWSYPYQSGITSNSEECQPFGGRTTPVAGISAYVQLPQNDAAALLAAVLQSPVSVSVAASTFGLYHSGIFDGCSLERPILNHAVVLMGYGVEDGVSYWLIRNSWGPTWGEGGYIRLHRFPDEEPCGIDDEPLDGYSCKSNPPEKIVACGMCGVLSDSAYPTGGFLGAPSIIDDPAVDGGDGLNQVKAHYQAGVPESADGAAFIQVPRRREL